MLWVFPSIFPAITRSIFIIKNTLFLQYMRADEAEESGNNLRNVRLRFLVFNLWVFLFYVFPFSHSTVLTFLGSEYDEEEVDYEDSDSDESWTTESAISSEAILSSMCMNGGDEKPFACPVPGCKKRYKVCVFVMWKILLGHDRVSSWILDLLRHLSTGGIWFLRLIFWL